VTLVVLQASWTLRVDVTWGCLCPQGLNSERDKRHPAFDRLHVNTMQLWSIAASLLLQSYFELCIWAAFYIVARSDEILLISVHLLGTVRDAAFHRGL
jgi:hypothetical protein